MCGMSVYVGFGVFVVVFRRGYRDIVCLIVWDANATASEFV